MKYNKQNALNRVNRPNNLWRDTLERWLISIIVIITLLLVGYQFVHATNPFAQVSEQLP
jgi:hypothetical protein